MPSYMQKSLGVHEVRSALSDKVLLYVILFNI